VPVMRGYLARGVFAAIAVLSVAVVLAACGSSSKSTGTGSSSSAASQLRLIPTPAELRARLNLAKCMRNEGISVPDPTASGAPAGALVALLQNLTEKYGRARLQQAIAGCQRYVSQSFPRLATTPQARAQRLHDAVIFTECLRAHGVDVPDPIGNGPDYGLGRALSQVDQSSPTFKSALTVCVDRVSKLPGAVG
jgi:hypothetical protein